MKKLLLSLFAIFFATSLHAQTAVLMPIPHQCFSDVLTGNAKPLAGGKIFTYQAGTAIPQQTYTDSTGAVQNANPVIFDASGCANIWFATASPTMWPRRIPPGCRSGRSTMSPD